MDGREISDQGQSPSMARSSSSRACCQCKGASRYRRLGFRSYSRRAGSGATSHCKHDKVLWSHGRCLCAPARDPQAQHAHLQSGDYHGCGLCAVARYPRALHVRLQPSDYHGRAVFVHLQGIQVLNMSDCSQETITAAAFVHLYPHSQHSWLPPPCPRSCRHRPCLSHHRPCLGLAVKYEREVVPITVYSHRVA